MDVVSLINMKGGVGKTTTCHNLAGAFALAGRRVLAVDNDPQSSLTQGMLGTEAASLLGEDETIARVYAGTAIPGALIRPAGIAGVDLVPGSIHTDEHNQTSPARAPWVQQTALRDFLAGVAGDYDIVLVDCPPNLHLCSWAALAASDWALIPVQPEDYGVQGLVPVRAAVDGVRATLNPGLALLGFVITMGQPRRAVHNLYRERLRDYYGSEVLDAELPDAAEFPEAIIAGRPVTHWKPRSKTAKAVVALGAEILARLEAGQGTTQEEAA